MAFIAKQRYKIDIAPRGGWVIVYASQHDDGAREIEFEITNQGKSFSIPELINVSVQGIKSNGSYFSHSCSYSGNIVTMALADDMTDIIGKSICVLKFTNSSQQKLATAKFVLNVDTDASSEGVIIDTEAEEIFNQMLNEIRAQAASISVDIAELQSDIAGLQSMVGSPLVASLVSEMVDTDKIYVYVGSETGYTNGNWYYWNGSAWTSGGVYNSTAFETDKTLSVENMAADAKAVGDEIGTIKSAEPITIYFSDFEQGYRHGRTNCNKVVNATWVISKEPIEFKKGQVLQSEDSTLYEFSVVDPTPSNNGQVLVATRSANYTFTENITGYLEARLKSKENVTPETLNGKYFTTEQYELLKILNSVTDVTEKCSTYYVNGSSGSDSNSGTIDAPFATIQKAIDMGGENVLVSIGIYPEILQIKDTDKLRLMPYPTPSYDAVIGAQKIQIQKLYINNCRNVYVSNFLIDNSSSWCFRCNNSYNVVVENCEAQNGILGGFLAYNSNIIFRNCTAHDIGDSTNYNSDGFNFHETGYSELYNCTAYDCVDDGISHHENTSGLISACTVYDCGSTVRGGGIAPTGNAEIKAANCIMHGCFRGFEAENLTKPAFLIGCVMYNNTTDCYVNNAQATLYGSKYTSVFGADNITILD